MKLKIYKKWHKKAEFEGLLFFAQVLDEMYFDYTLDTYKPPALTSRYLCLEAIELIRDIEDDLIDEANLSHVLDELDYSLRGDPVAKQLIDAPIEKFILRGEAVKLAETKVRLEVLKKTLHPLRYITLAQEELLLAIENKSKSEMVALARLLSSSLINNGMSKQHLYEKTQEFFFNGQEITSIDATLSYFESTSPVIHHYEIYFIVSNMISKVKESIGAFSINIIDSPPRKALEEANNYDMSPNSDEVWVEVNDIEAGDHHTARKVAESNLDMTRDLFLLFSHKNRIEWREETVITQCCDETPIVIRKPKNSMEKCFDLRPKEASHRLNDLINTISLEGTSFIKFNRAVDLHGIGSTNDIPENQMINIWISLETLVPSHVHGGGKIIKIINGILPILLKKYIKRLIERVSADLVRWDRTKYSRLLRKIPNSKGKPLYIRTLELIALDENQVYREELFGLLDHFHLLRNRVFELNKLLKDKEKVLGRLELHQKKVSWQLRRIYRTRNLIVHSGRSPKYIETLIENGHDYLDQTMAAIIEYSCGYLSASTLEQVFDMAKLDYDTYTKNLKSIDSFNADNIVLLV